MAILKDLIVHGSSRFLNKIYASEIQTPLIEADAGIIKKLKADNVTVVGLLDVKGQLHTNSWSNSNIATIDGSFYITPTIGSDSGTVSITSSFLTFSGTNYAVSSLYLGDGSSITWPQYSKVLITGQVLINGEWIPLGTLLGQIRGTPNSASISIDNIKDNKNQTSNVYTTLVNSGVSSTDYRNLKISLYQRAAGQTDFRPLGIYMTATGTNGRTFLDIYGGVEALSNSNNYGGFAEPNVRIGNLQGLPNVGGQTPSGWGIYTDNGYFKGIIAADQGYIGSGSRYWVIANYEDGSNPNNSRSYIYSYNGTDNGTNSTTSTVEGIYLGTDGIRNYKDSTHHVTIKNGVITALGVNLTGEITASSGSIGGWNIGTDTNKSLYYGNQTPGATTTNLVLSPTSATNSNAIGGSGTGLKWFISAGKVFGVTTAGALYCNDAHISGEITATSGTIGGASITDGTLIVGNANINDINASKINAGDIAAARIQTNLISAINAKVSDLSALTATIGGFQIDSSSIHTKNVAITSNADNSIALSSADFTRTINSTSRTGLRFAIGDKFGVTGDGTIYASNVDLTGKITATSGTIGGINIIDGDLDVSSISIGINQVTNLQTTLNSKQAAGDYATNTALNSVSTTASTALNQSVEYIKGTQTGSGVAAWTGVTTESTLRDGKIIMYYLPVKSASNVTLNLTLADNTTTGAIPVYLNYSTSSNDSALTRVSTHYPAGSVIQMTYDGVANQWKTTGYNTNVNTNTIGTLGATKLKAGTNASNASATTVYRWTLIMKKTIGSNPTWVSLVTSSSNGTSKTRYTGGLYPDQIFYMSANYSSSPYGYSTGATIGDSYAALGFDLRYSTNCGSTLAIGKPVYLVGEINPLDGLFYLDSTWWTQTEPTTENGKTYIYLGNAYSTTNVYLVEKNPLMRYYRGAFRTEEEIAGMTATSYITYINANDGIKIHNESDTLNYLQLNSTAISMYRNRGDGINSDEVLRIDDTGIRVGKANEAHFSLTSSRLTGYGNNNNIYFDVGQGDNTAIQLFYGNGDRTAFEMGPLVKGTSQFPKGIKSVKKDGNTLTETTDYTIQSTSIWYDIYFEEEPAAYSTVTIEYISAYKELLYTVGSSQNITTEQQTFPDGRVATHVTLDSQKTFKAKELWVKESGQEEWQLYNEDSQYHVSQINNNYKYYLFVDTGTQIKLVYFILDDPSFISDPDVQIENYLWDITHQGSLSLTIRNVYGINSIKVNNTNVNYTSEGPLYYDYLVFNTAPALNEKIEVEFFTRNYNSQYYSTYLNFSNMNKENSVKGIGAVSFGSENVNKGVFCLVEGASNTVTGYASHAQGYNNIVAGSHAHVGGINSLALGQNTFVHGDNLQATYLNSAAFGYYNNPENQLFSIGRGNYENAFSINKDGDVQIGGGLLAGTAYEDKKPLFKIIEKSLQVGEVGTNGSKTQVRDISVTGYKPIAILGIVVANLNGVLLSGYVDASWCVVPRFWIGYDYTQEHSNYKTDDIYYYIWNLNTSRKVMVEITFKFLYIAQTAYIQQQTS